MVIGVGGGEYVGGWVFVLFLGYDFFFWVGDICFVVVVVLVLGLWMGVVWGVGECVWWERMVVVGVLNLLRRGGMELVCF